MVKIASEVLAVLGNCTFAGNMLYLPPGQLDRKLYEAVNKVLDANGGKWNRGAKAHVFDEPAEAAIEQALLTGEFHRTKQDLGQFDTPPAIADRVCQLADLKAGQLIYEPSAGIGNLVAAAIRVTNTGATIFANEIDPKRHAQCVTTNYRAFGAGGISMRDFLTMPTDKLAEENLQFDRVIMNPPFAKQADIDHVLHALKFVKPGGRLVAIMSASVTFRTNRKTTDFWHYIESTCRSHYREALPAGAFAESGTNVNAVIVAVDV